MQGPADAPAFLVGRAAACGFILDYTIRCYTVLYHTVIYYKIPYYTIRILMLQGFGNRVPSRCLKGLYNKSLQETFEVHDAGDGEQSLLDRADDSIPLQPGARASSGVGAACA